MKFETRIRCVVCALLLACPASDAAPNEDADRRSDRGSEEVILERPREGPDEPTKVYRADDCIGAVVNGVCHGSVIDTDPARQRCHGAWINGQCTGPQF
jgi:hypothetical protein